MSRAKRQLMLCADDFGQSEQISLGILELIAAGRLTATSVMSGGPYWPTGAHKLAALQHLADVGLHLNLTHIFSVDRTKRPLPYWLIMSELRLLSRRKLIQLFCHQIDAFKKHLGKLPDFIDGHQHVHAFPVIRDALTDAIAASWPANAKKPWLRAPDQLIDGGDAPFKAQILRFLCSGFTAHVTRQGLRVTTRFGGLYSLQPEVNFARQMQHWLRTAPHGSLLMCHPGTPASDKLDPINAARGPEYNYLVSTDFAKDCVDAGVALSRFEQIS